MKKIALVMILCLMIVVVPVIAEVVTVKDIAIPTEVIEKSYYINEIPMTVKNMMPLETMELCTEC